jgi:hypothetical protein
MALKRFGVAVTAAAALLAIYTSVAAAAGPPNNSYLCYSTLQVDPGVWSDSPTGIMGGLGGNISSSALLKLGYWQPFAEKSTPTKTVLPGGWYLHCNPPGVTVSGGTPPTTIIGGAGEIVANTSLYVFPGYYPMVP